MTKNEQNNESNIKITIIGGSGYAGGELLRLLLRHPKVEIDFVTSNRYNGEFIYNLHPNLRGHSNLKFTSLNTNKISQNSHTVFLATPHGTSKDIVPELLDSGLNIIDLSADYRLKNSDEYPLWYGFEHPNPELLKIAVYGIPELYRNELRDAKLVACAGCMATASILALTPIVKSGLVKPEKIVVDAKIGSSGGGRTPTPANHHTERYSGLRPYQVTGHRHIAEIEQEVSLVSGYKTQIGFTPHAINIARGILITAHLWLNKIVQDRDIWKTYRSMYNEASFIRFVKTKKGLHQLPNPRNLLGTNLCDIGFQLDHHVDRVVVFSAIDNLVKGAAGQAVQCFNVINGFDEKTGLDFIGFN
jgi:N-acetyl-gamma-glutamyl-phosphate/LysW-gamma-L-alpha-aminoadipyl-6-phosphate reductase